MHKINFMFTALFKSCSMKRIVSLAYCRIDTPPQLNEV